MNCAEPAAHGYHDDGQPAHDGGSHFSRGTVESTAAPTPAWSVPWCPGGLAGQAASAGPRTGSCCCSCKSDISSSRKLGGHVPSNCLSAPRQLLYTVSALPLRQLLYTVSALPLRQLLYTVPVPPDSSSALSAGAPRQLLYTVS